MSVTLVTDKGPIKIELYAQEAPRCSENFLALCAKGAYDETLIHRNIKGFMVQMGDPTGTGKGGESVWGGKFDDEIDPGLRHDKRGIVSMANAGPNTNGSQFFITYDAQPHLDGKYSIFGQYGNLHGVADSSVIYGADTTLKLIEEEPVGKKNRPLHEMKLQRVIIHANPFAE